MTPTYASGLCQPGQTSADCSGSRYLTVPDHASLNPSGDFTLEALVYPTADGVGGGILQKGNIGGLGSYSLGRDASNKFTCVLNGAATVVAGSASPKNAWYYVVATRTGSVVNFYVNGTLAASLTYTPTLTPVAEPLYLGRWQSTGAVFPGADRLCPGARPGHGPGRDQRALGRNPGG